VNRPTRVLVTGAAGQVGRDAVDWLEGVEPAGSDPAFNPDRRPVDAEEFEVLALTRHELDVADTTMVERVVAATRPDVIVHLAAYTAVDRAEDEPDQCFAVNATGTAALASAARSHGAHLIAVSSDYVFDGTKGAPYVEGDATNPLSVYGASKLAGEHACDEADTVVRASWVLGVRGRNVLDVIAARARAGEKVRFVADQVGTVTLAADLARALVAMVRTRPGGTWHFANDGATTWFELAAYAGELLGRAEGFATPIRASELVPAPRARRPARSDLDTTKWRGAFDATPPPWREGVARLLAGRGS
jgi:dTDP-4-dehydrorhamnose reductase